MMRHSPAGMMTLSVILGWAVVAGLVLFIAGLCTELLWMTLWGVVLIWVALIAGYRLGKSWEGDDDDEGK